MDLNDFQQLAIIKMANDVTYKRLNRTLADLPKLSSTRLAEILLGEAGYHIIQIIRLQVCNTWLS